MKAGLGWAIALGAFLALSAGAVELYRLGKADRDKEAKLEQPLRTPSRLSRGKDGSVVLAFPAPDRERLGIRTQILPEKVEPRQVVAYGRVLSPAPLLALEGERSQALTALGASQAEFERTKTLFQENQNASKKALDAAQAQFHADQIRLRLAERQLSTEWGEAVGSLAREGEDSLAERLATRKSVLVRVTLLPGATLEQLPTVARVAPAALEEKFVQAGRIFDAPQVDPKSQGRGLFLLLNEPGALFVPGAAVTAHLQVAGDALSGVEIPRAAVVRHGGRNWVYVLLDEEHLERREVALDHPTRDGWFSTSKLGPQFQVVVSGPQMLLSEELKGEIHASD